MFRTLCIHSFIITILLATPISAAASQASVEQIAADYGLSTSTSLPFPTATQNPADTQKLIIKDWSLGKGAVQDNPDNLAFVADPFPNKPVAVPSNHSTSGPVLQVTYPQGSFSSETGGSQWYNLWNATAGSKFQTLLASYEVAFDENFDWVKGGKLPGLRGSTKSNTGGCSSEKEKAANTTDCFDVRLMWRKDGAGEIYADVPNSDNLCSRNGVSCSENAVSIQRGSFGFVSGQWNRITLVVRLNDPADVANGEIQLYYNDLRAIDQQGLQIRTNPQVYLNGFYFSTFFGGSDKTWETPRTTHTYYRNVIMYGGSVASNDTGNVVSSNKNFGHTIVPGFRSQLLAFVLGSALAAFWL